MAFDDVMAMDNRTNVFYRSVVASIDAFCRPKAQIEGTMEMVALGPQNLSKLIPIVVREIGMDNADGAQGGLNFDHGWKFPKRMGHARSFIFGSFGEPFASDSLVVDMRIGVPDGSSPSEKFMVSRN